MRRVISKTKVLTADEDSRMRELQEELELEKEDIIALGRKILAERTAILQDVMETLRSVKDKEGLSLADLQTRTGIDRAQLSRLLSGESSMINPSLSTLLRIASGLGRRLKLTMTKQQ